MNHPAPAPAPANDAFVPHLLRPLVAIETIDRLLRCAYKAKNDLDRARSIGGALTVLGDELLRTNPGSRYEKTIAAVVAVGANALRYDHTAAQAARIANAIEDALGEIAAVYAALVKTQELSDEIAGHAERAVLAALYGTAAASPAGRLPRR